MIKRSFDIILAIILLVIFIVPMAIIALIIKVSSRGPVLHWSKRIGINNTTFNMAKFRTMVVDAPQLATHLMENPDPFITKIGRFLRKISFDELPQLINILRGDMSFVGPRPALFNQDDLVKLRTKKKIHTLMPGLTGWAQVNGRDDLPIPIKVVFDEYYLKNRSLSLDFMILFLTVIKVIKGEGIQH